MILTLKREVEIIQKLFLHKILNKHKYFTMQLLINTEVRETGIYV